MLKTFSRRLQDILKTNKCLLGKLVFANNAVLSFFFFFLIIIDLYLWIAAVIVKILNPPAGPVTLIVISTKEAKAEVEARPVTTEAKIRKYSK